MNKKKRIGILAIFIAIVVGVVLIRDASIQSDREEDSILIRKYENEVQIADSELRYLESEEIKFEDLEEIATMQLAIQKTAKLLIDLAPVLASKDEVNRYSQASVSAYNRSVTSYNTNIRIYTSQMTNLNRIVDRANKNYEIRIVSAAVLDREALSTEKKFLELIGLAPAPKSGPASEIEEINRGIEARSEQQRAIRTRWNTEASQINSTNQQLNALRNKLLELFGTRFGGISVDEAKDVKTSRE